MTCCSEFTHYNLLTESSMSSVYFGNDTDRFCDGRYMKKILPIAFAVLCVISTAQAADQHRHRSTRHHRRQSAAATATCQDGTTSYRAHRRGTCSHHGGV